MAVDHSEGITPKRRRGTAKPKRSAALFPLRALGNPDALINGEKALGAALRAT